MRGFSTLEMLIAMAILIAVLSAVVFVSFGDQSMLAEGEMQAEALQKAEALLQQEEANARKDFRLLHPSAASVGRYDTSILVSDWPQDRYATKQITARVSWSDEHNAARELALSALVSDFQHVPALDTCDPFLSGDWNNPHIASYSLQTLLATSSGVYTVSGVDAYQGKLYVTAAKTTYKTDPTLYIFDIADPSRVTLLAALDNDSASAVGPNAVEADGRYAWAANASRPATTGQLQVFDVSDPRSPSIVASFPISGNSGQGNSIFYKKGYAYLGLTKSGTNGQFAVVDVHDPAHPFVLGTYTVGASVETIYVRDSYAYLATDDSARELVVLNVADPSAPSYASAYNASDAGFGDGFGRALYTVGDTLYLGRTYLSGAPEFYVLDASNPAAIPAAPLGASDIGPGHADPYGVYGLIVRDYLAFVLTKAGSGGQLRVLAIADPSNITQTASSTLPGGSGGVALDCEGNTLYAVSIDASNNGYLSVITAGS